MNDMAGFIINKFLNQYRIVYQGAEGVCFFRSENLTDEEVLERIHHITIFPERYKVLE